MKRSEIVEAFYNVKKELCEYSTRHIVAILEVNGRLEIGLLALAEEVPDENNVIVVTEHFIGWIPDKPFTTANLIKISKIWKELLKTEWITF